jgi:hypothetical protein
MGNLRLSEKERRRLEVFNRVKRGEVSLLKGGELLGLSYRQSKRSYSRWQADGDESLVHGLRGKASNRRSAGALKKRVLRLYERKYKDFGPTLAAEYLSEELGEEIKTSTLRRWLMAEGLWKKHRRRGAHWKWRARQDHFGVMLPMDGSEHDWFAGRRARAVPIYPTTPRPRRASRRTAQRPLAGGNVPRADGSRVKPRPTRLDAVQQPPEAPPPRAGTRSHPPAPPRTAWEDGGQRRTPGMNTSPLHSLPSPLSASGRQTPPTSRRSVNQICG